MYIIFFFQMFYIDLIVIILIKNVSLNLDM